MVVGRLLTIVFIVALVLVAAETGFVGSPSDVYVRNDTDRTVSTTVTVIDPGVFGIGDSVAAEKQVTLAPGEAAEVGGVIELDLVVTTLNAHDIVVKENGRTVATTAYGGCRAVGVFLQEMTTRFNCFHTDPCGSDNPFARNTWC